MKIAGEKPVRDLPADALLASPGAADPLPRGAGLVLIGPEGGLAPEEEGRFLRRFGLGPTILRIETAAVVAAARLLS